MTSRSALIALALVAVPGLGLAAAVLGGPLWVPVVVLLFLVLLGLCTGSGRQASSGGLPVVTLTLGVALGALTGVGVFAVAIVVGIFTNQVAFLSIYPARYEHLWTAGSSLAAVAAGVAVLVITVRRSRSHQPAQASLASQ